MPSLHSRCYSPGHLGYLNTVDILVSRHFAVSKEASVGIASSQGMKQYTTFDKIYGTHTSAEVCFFFFMQKMPGMYVKHPECTRMHILSSALITKELLCTADLGVHTFL